jgi:hypothetical protein
MRGMFSQATRQVSFGGVVTWPKGWEGAWLMGLQLHSPPALDLTENDERTSPSSTPIAVITELISDLRIYACVIGRLLGSLSRRAVLIPFIPSCSFQSPPPPYRCPYFWRILGFSCQWRWSLSQLIILPITEEQSS